MCPHCSCETAWWDSRSRYRCQGCQKQVSVTSGTVLHRTRIPLTVWFEAAWLITASKTGVSAAHLHRVLPVSSYQSTWTLLSKFRQVMTTAESRKLEGRVEVDETFFGGPRPGVKGRGALGKTLVAGAVSDHGWGRARLAVISDASKDSLQSFVRANIGAGAAVVTDGWPSYPPALTGYKHSPVNVSASKRPAHESLPAVHRLFAQVKRTLEGTYQGSASVEHLQEYLDEFVFRFNRCHAKHRGLVFLRLLARAVHAPPTTYKNLVKVQRAKSKPATGHTGPRTRPGTLEVTEVGYPWRTEPSRER